MAEKKEQNPLGRYKPRKATTKPNKTPKDREVDRSDEDKSATYRIGKTLRDRINDVSQEHHVQKSSLVKFLLLSAIEQLENGELELPDGEYTRPKKLNI